MSILSSSIQTVKKAFMDRGIRKYTLVLICLGFISAGYVLTGILSTTAAQYSTFTGGVLTLYAVYCGGNVLSKQYAPTENLQQVSDKEESK